MNNFALYAAAVLIWGSTWLLINFQLGTVAPEVSVVYRYAIATVLLMAFAWVRRLRLRFSLQDHFRFVLLGLLLFSFNYIATYSAQVYIPSALNAVAFSTMVWMNILNARLFFGTRIETRVWLGASLGMLGVVVLFWPEVAAISFTDKTLIGASFSLSGALLASFGNMVSTRAQGAGVPVLQANAWGMFYGTLITAAVAWRKGLPFNFEYTFSYVSSLLYLAIFGSIVAFGCYLKLVGRIGPARAGYAVVMFPVVAFVLSVLFEDLAIELHIVAGVVLVLLGNLVILGFREIQLAAGRLKTRYPYLFETKQVIN
ncbi:MAG: EamA family transporter [Xanthomonadales bacterium]|nr:EamA family transporter [Xanthomonadales bacterium]